MSRKKFFLLVVTFVLAFIISVVPILVGCGADEEEEEEELYPCPYDQGDTIPIVYATSASSASLTEQALVGLFEMWDEATPDYDIEVEYHYADELFAGSQAVEALASGALDMGAAVSYTYEGYEPAFGLFSVPFLWSSFDHYLRFFDTPEWQVVHDRYAESGIEIAYETLGWSISIPYFIDKEVTTLEDLQGLRIRTFESPIMARSVELLGANSLVVPMAELTMAMQTGMIDGMFGGTGRSYILMLGYLDYMKTALFLEANFYATSKGFNAYFWYTLPDDVRLAFNEIWGEHYYEVANVPSIKERWVTFEVLDEAITVTSLTPQEFQRWLDAEKPLRDELDQQLGGGLLDAIMRTREGPGLSPIDEYLANIDAYLAEHPNATTEWWEQ